MKSKLGGRKPEAINPGKGKLLIYSKSGYGKTQFVLGFPTPFYFDCEGGARLQQYQRFLAESNGCYFGIEDGAQDFPTVLSQVEALATEKHPYKTLAFGSITKLYQSAIAAEQHRLGDRDQFGASKKPAISAMRQLVMWIHRIDMNVVFEAHEVVEWGQNPKTGQREEIGNGPDVWDKLVYELDLTLRLEKRGPQRIFQVKKSRLTGFPEGDQFPCEYSEFAARYGKDFIEAPVTPIELATETQVTEIKRLLSVVNVPEKELEGLLSRAKADNIHELSSDYASKMLDWLKKKVA